MPMVRGGHGSRLAAPAAPWPGRRPIRAARNQHAGIEQQPHRSRKRFEQKILRQRLVEISCDVAEDLVDPVLPLELLDRFQPHSALLSMGRKIEDRLAMARDYDGLAFFD